MRVLALAIALALPASAIAQTTTDCTTDYFGNVHCTTNSRSTAPVDYVSGLGPLPDAGKAFREGMERGAAMRAQAQSQHVAKMIAAGDCPGAENYALQQGNFDLAKSVRDYCSK